MCVGVRVGAMGCGKSKHRSMEDSELDMKNNKNNSGSGGSSNNNSNNSGSSNKKENSWSSGGGGKKKKNSNNANDNKTSGKDGDKEEKTSPFKLLANGKTNRSGSGRSEEVGVPAGLSASGKTNGNGGGVGEKSNGSLSSNRAYALEIPDEINKLDSHQKTTCRDFKSLTSSKTVHVTNSQIEFFKMLDEKIEKGEGYATSADVSEVSSLDENFRH